jgi:hypothetical protein
MRVLMQEECQSENMGKLGYFCGDGRTLFRFHR